jgi:Ca2+-transporting ATPase
MTGIVAGSIAAGWSPIDRRGEPDFGQFPRPGPAGQESQAPADRSVLGDEMLSDEPQEMSEEPEKQQQDTADVPILSMPKPRSPSTPKAEE